MQMNLTLHIHTSSYMDGLYSVWWAWNWTCSRCSCIFSLCFLLFSNQVLRVFNLLLLIGLLLIHAIEYFERSDYKIFLPEWCKDIVSLGITLPFAKLDRPVVLIKEEVSSGKREKIKVIGKVLVGVLLTLPILLVVIRLLASSDGAFQGIINVALNSLFSVNFSWFFVRGFTVVILFFVLFSYFYGLTYPEKEMVITDASLEVGANEKRIRFCDSRYRSNLIMLYLFPLFLIPVCLFYISFSGCVT